MANAKIDENRIPTILAVSSTDGSTLLNVGVNPVNKGLKVDDNTTGDDLSTNENDLRDENRKTGLMAVSAVDGVSLVELYADSEGKLLINSN